MTDTCVEVLLVEDNPNDVDLALHAFSKHRLANRVQVVRDGAEALEFLFCAGRYANRPPSDAPHLVLLDLKLPLVDGVEVLRQMKDNPRTQPIPVVVMTSSNEERDVVETYQLGVNSYIVKPVDFEKFTETTRLLGLYWLLINRPPVPSNRHGPDAGGNGDGAGSS